MPYVVKEVVPRILLDRRLRKVPPTDSSSKCNKSKCHPDVEAPQEAKSHRPDSNGKNKARPSQGRVYERKCFTTNQPIT